MLNTKENKQNSYLYNVFPGEHYILLAGMVKIKKQKTNYRNWTL